MGLPVMCDFKLDSGGHCFFCLNKIFPEVSHGHQLGATPQFKKHHVHYLARHLGMDMGKVLNHEGQIDSTLLAKVRRSRLKVELCDKCTSLNDKVSGLCRQLEKLEIEINSNVRLIHEQLLGADQSSKLQNNLANFHLNSSIKSEVSQIVDVLREEAIKKCSQKWRVVAPRVEIHKLTNKQIDAELFKRQTNPGKVKVEPDILSPEESIEPGQYFKSKLEPQGKNLLRDDNDGTSNYDMDIEGMDDEEPTTNNGLRVSLRPKDSRTEIPNNENEYTIIAPASTSTNTFIKGKHSINPESRKWKCGACPMEFSSNAGVHFHHKSVHQKIRFKCIPCGKEFARQTAYNHHHRSVHVGVRFKCLVCKRLFTQKVHLQVHQRGSRCVAGQLQLS